MFDLLILHRLDGLEQHLQVADVWQVVLDVLLPKRLEDILHQLGSSHVEADPGLFNLRRDPRPVDHGQDTEDFLPVLRVQLDEGQLDLPLGFLSLLDVG